MYQVEQTYRNFITGEAWVRVLPKVYVTCRGAERAAQARSWVTRPHGGTASDSSDAHVIERN